MKKNNYKSKLIFLTFIFTVFFILFLSIKECSTNNILDYYGFYDKEQKLAMSDLCKLASIEDIYANKVQNEHIIENIVRFIEETQKKFFIRTNNQERWDTKNVDWIQKNEEKVHNDLDMLGFINTIMPKIMQPDAVCILGSTKGSMERRIQFVEFLLKNNEIKSDTIIFLVGERNATVNVDGSNYELLSIAKKFNMTDYSNLTETHLAMYLYENSHLKNIETFFIDTLSKNNQRPTTQTTIVEFVNWLKQHKNVKNIVFISGQPHVKYQKAIISAIFDGLHVNVNFEVIGNATKKNLSAQTSLEGLGSYIWAHSPHIFKKINAKNANKSIKERLKNLYSNQKIMYQCLPDYCK